MKVLDVHAFETGMDETRQKITTLSSQLKQTEESVNQLISLSDAFKGEGPQAILTFFEQYHTPLLKTYHTFCADYQLTIDQMRHALFGFEPDPNGFIRQIFLENELEQGIIRARTTTIELTNEANAIMQTVSDIVALPHLREDSVVRACDEAIQYKQDTIEKLVEFDILQTKSLAPIESLLQSINNQIQFMEDVFIQGDTSIHVKTTAVEGLSCERPETAIKEKKAWYEIVGNVIIGAIEGIVKAVVDIFKGLFDLLKSLFTDPIGFFKGIVSAIFNPVDTVNAMWGAVETAWERDVINGDARSRASFFSYTVVSVVGLKGFDKLGKAGKLGHTASKVDNNIPYNAFRTDKLKELVKTNVYANLQQKAKQTADLLKSNFGKEAINKTIQAAKNSEILTKARNTLNPTNMKAASKKIYEDVVKAPIAKTQDWMQKKKEQILEAPIPNVGPIPLGPSLNMTVRDGIEATKDSFSKIVGDKDGERNGTKGMRKDKGVSEANLLAEFAKNNGVESLPLSYEEILKFCGGRRDLAENLVIATKEAVGGKTIPELVVMFKLPNNPTAGSLSTYQTRLWYKWQESLIDSKLDYSKPLEQVAKDAFEMRNTIRTQARLSMSDQAWAKYLMENEKNMTFEQLVKRNIDKGLTGDELWNKIIQSSMSSRDSVNSLFQLD